MAAYLGRIGASPGDGLRELQFAHLTAVPFENLSIHLGEPIVLEQPALYEKIVTRRRGGFCYELNGLFAELLAELGHRVELLSARVFDGDLPGVPFDHLTLRVDEVWLVDVGFGAFSHHPLRLDDSGVQNDPAGQFQVVALPCGDYDVVQDGKPQYRVDGRPQALRDFVPTCWWHQTSPQSHFTQSLTCSLLTESGRITISGDRLIRTEHGRRSETTLASDELIDAYRRHFGFTLTRVPRLSPAAGLKTTDRVVPAQTRDRGAYQ